MMSAWQRMELDRWMGPGHAATGNKAVWILAWKSLGDMDGLQQKVEHQQQGSCRKILLLREGRTGWGGEGVQGALAARDLLLPWEGLFLGLNRGINAGSLVTTPHNWHSLTFLYHLLCFLGRWDKSGVPEAERCWVLNPINCSQVDFHGSAGRWVVSFSSGEVSSIGSWMINLVVLVTNKNSLSYAWSRCKRHCQREQCNLAGRRETHVSWATSSHIQIQLKLKSESDLQFLHLPPLWPWVIALYLIPIKRRPRPSFLHSFPMEWLAVCLL